MSDTDTDPTEVDKWDRGMTEHVVALTRLIAKRYFRSEVRGLDNIPPGASLVVGNHTGGLTSFDLSVFAVGYYDKYGYERRSTRLALTRCSPDRPPNFSGAPE
jgi:hypothetical protein